MPRAFIVDAKARTSPHWCGHVALTAADHILSTHIAFYTVACVIPAAVGIVGPTCTCASCWAVALVKGIWDACNKRSTLIR